MSKIINIQYIFHSNINFSYYYKHQNWKHPKFDRKHAIKIYRELNYVKIENPLEGV